MTDYNLPPGPFNIILADPPWKYRNESCRGAAANHYPTVSEGELKRLSVESIAAQTAALFMWGTYPKLPEMIELGTAWGFTYKTIAFQWIKRYRSGKPFFGNGHYTRSNTEGCFLFTRGPKALPRLVRNISQIVETVPDRHSAKPPVVRELIVKLLGDLPRIELFARDRVDGWTSWGNEV